MHATSRNRLIAIGMVALLGVGGAAAGIALRPEVPAVTLPAVTRSAVRQATSLSDAFIAISEAVTPAVVRIEAAKASHAKQVTGVRDLPGQQPALEVAGGTGFIVSSDGYILTNHHVVANAERITVTLRDKRTLDAVVVGGDPMTDVAVIRVQAKGLPAVTLGNSDDARVGEWVLAVGNPGFADAASTLDFTVTGGIISAKGRPLGVLGANLEAEGAGGSLYAIEDFIQTDAVINPGNSGGPLVDLQGTVIGINTAIASTTGYSQGYGFAIPSNLAQRVMRDLIEHGYVRRPLLGVQIADVTSEDAELYGLPAIAGVLVEDFSDDSPAYAAGLRRHDVIVAVDSTPVERVGQLQRLVALHQPGDLVPISVVRRGNTLELKVKVIEAEGAGRPAAVVAGPRFPNGLGLEIEELTPGLARQLGFSRAGGALIARVLPASAADAKQIGDNHLIVEIDGKAIESAEQARAILRKARQGQILSFVIQYPDQRSYIANVRMP